MVVVFLGLLDLSSTVLRLLDHSVQARSDVAEFSPLYTLFNVLVESIFDLVIITALNRL